MIDENEASARDDSADKDEYDLALAEGIDDEALLEKPGTSKFTISSYGADYTVDTLVKRMRGEAFKIPEFQRKFVWTLKHASKFIESLLMGLPVPGIFLYKESETNEHLVIDGQQRLRTLQAFYDGIFRGKEFQLQGVREPWNEKTYKTLDPADVLKLDDSIVHATIFKQDKPEDVLDSIYFVFERINTGGIRLSPQEIRNCVSLGPFTNRVKALNSYTAWRTVFGPPNNRSKDEELIVRFFALYCKGDTYSRPMNSFLNKFSAVTNKVEAAELDRLDVIFKRTIEKVNSAIGVRAFRIIRALNAAAFDAVMVGLARRLERNPDPSDQAVALAYDALVAQDEFRQACERSTADEDNVRKRLTLSTAAFADI
ncbi:DUF262 domain-containing protein [Rhizobium leguminosarum bv. viciae]|uniref:DUF262 domain-containing protein n=1 Tax=Rhizobium leguminosarum TaxID=384 RepID=UPI00103BE371|nr:DUF262 domain-containing protein [Rhizobium leguminosarum]TBY28407.1 DUF262 domain-containing protein [Rhizobium leguminosarum bv. viciae]TCB02252.1 DUF262 domain-containing protein [Rhizobium leguminosarum bv. viciae]